MQEQIRLFNSLPPAQRQALILELQRSLPPAQREAIVGLLQGNGQPTTELYPEAENALADALVGQTAGEDLTAAVSTRAESFLQGLRREQTLADRVELFDRRRRDPCVSPRRQRTEP